MFVSRCGRTVNFATALRWHNSGIAVTIDGWVKITRTGQTKEIKNPNKRKPWVFEDIIDYHPKWNIETENIAVPFFKQRTLFCKSTEHDRRALAEKVKKAIDTSLDKKIDTSLMSIGKKKLKKLHKAGKITKTQARRKVVDSIDISESECAEKMPVMWGNFNNLKDRWIAQGKGLNIFKGFHGTRCDSIGSILTRGFMLPYGPGMLGKGIYVGKMDKARNYGDGIILKVEVMLGSCKELTEVESMQDNLEFDSMHIGSGARRGVFKGFLRNEEWIIKDPAQIRVVGIIIRSR